MAIITSEKINSSFVAQAPIWLSDQIFLIGFSRRTTVQPVQMPLLGASAQSNFSTDLFLI